jgi:hypothetical protein
MIDPRAAPKSCAIQRRSHFGCVALSGISA